MAMLLGAGENALKVPHNGPSEQRIYRDFAGSRVRRAQPRPFRYAVRVRMLSLRNWWTAD